MDTVQELFDYAMAFGNQPMPSSDRMSIVTNAGGPGIMATDACVRYGMRLARFGGWFGERLLDGSAARPTPEGKDENGR